jgi:hypothetical protein
MKTAAIIAIILTLIGLSFTWLLDNDACNAAARIDAACKKIETNLGNGDVAGATRCLHGLEITMKGLRLDQEVQRLGILIALPSFIGALILLIFAIRKRPSQPLQPTPESGKPPANVVDSPAPSVAER